MRRNEQKQPTKLPQLRTRCLTLRMLDQLDAVDERKSPIQTYLVYLAGQSRPDSIES